MSKEVKSLGETLKQLRLLIPLTLRQVEEAIGVSNAYLSQLENDKIKKPSCNVLYKLSALYNVDLDVLLLPAGFINETKALKPNGTIITAANITPEEEARLLEYLQFLRSKKPNP